jgi:hypothetical protein
VAVAAGPVAGAGAAAPAEEAEERQEDPGHQGGPRAHQSRPEGGQGPGRLGAQAGAGARAQGAGRQGQGPARGRGRQRGTQVARAGTGGGRIPPPSVHPLTLFGVGGKLGRTRRSEVPTQTLSSTLTAV